jgi:hypothetical protein
MKPIVELPIPYKVEEEALLREGQKVIFWVDLITRDRVRIISEYRRKDGKIMRLKEWLSEDDSLQWRDYDGD